MLEDCGGVEHQDFIVPLAVYYARHERSESIDKYLSHHACQDIIALFLEGRHRSTTSFPVLIVWNTYIETITVFFCGKHRQSR